MDILVNVSGLLLIVAIVWWFWLSKPSTVAQQGIIRVLVDNGVYTPARIRVKQGKAVTLQFLRKDPAPCAEKVIFADLNLAVDLPVNSSVNVTITPEKSGEIEFTCQMQMYRGSLIVE